MAKKLYVGNLSYNMTEDDLRETFGKLGEVLSAKIIMDNETGRSKGFGFVEMANDEDGDKAITSLNGTSQAAKGTPPVRIWRRRWWWSRSFRRRLRRRKEKQQLEITVHARVSERPFLS
jgi:cold-inducible RNA-binding protein